MLNRWFSWYLQKQVIYESQKRLLETISIFSPFCFKSHQMIRSEEFWNGAFFFSYLWIRPAVAKVRHGTRRNQERLRIGENLDCDTFSRKVVFTKLLDTAILHSDTKFQLPSATRCLARTVTMRPLYPTRSHFEIVLLWAKVITFHAPFCVFPF